MRWCLPEYRPDWSRQFQHGTRVPSTSRVRDESRSSTVGMKSSRASAKRGVHRQMARETEDWSTSKDSASSAWVRLRR
ncbi:hypothetical protein PRAC110570_13230 [Propionibacterium acidifaciens]